LDMLREIYIENFALIDELRVELEPGLNVFTGETGAGKSIMIDALELVLGGRASAGLVRTGCERAFVEALFDVSGVPQVIERLEHMGIPSEDNLVISRELNANGRSTAKMNGRNATASMLKEVCSLLVDLHGQHEHQSLLEVGAHIALLDAFAGSEVHDVRNAVRDLYNDLTRIKSEMRLLSGDERDRARRLDILRFQLDEIERVNPRPGEDIELEKEVRLLSSAQRLKAAAEAAYALLYEGRGESAIDLMGQAERELREVLRFDQSLEGVAEAIRGVISAVREVAAGLRGYAEGLDLDPRRLAEVESRLDRIIQLKAKYGDSIEEILVFAGNCKKEIERLVGSEEMLEELRSQKAAIEVRLAEACARLSTLRCQAARRLERLVSGELQGLGMGSQSFKVEIRPRTSGERIDAGSGGGSYVAENGADSVEFLIAPNPGETPKPLVRTASGGELSRIMLAIKSVMAEVDPVPTLVFDEIDAGVGGVAAQRVAARLKHTSRTHQVLCVTHLPQIASLADAHFVIWKEMAGERTRTCVRKVSGEARVQEVARMLAGSSTSEIAIRHARELIESAERTVHETSP